MAGWGIVSNDINIMFVQTRRPCFKEQRPTILRPVRMEEKLLTFPTFHPFYRILLNLMIDTKSREIFETFSPGRDTTKNI